MEQVFGLCRAGTPLRGRRKGSTKLHQPGGGRPKRHSYASEEQ